METTEFTFDFPVGTEAIDQSGKEEHVHYPMPSSDPTDPLNWSKGWKVLTFVSAQLFVFTTTFPIGAIPTLYVALITEYGVTVPQVSALTSWLVLVLGLANFIFIPYSMMYGRRPMLIISNFLTLVASIWFPLSKNYSSLFGSRLLLGIGSAALEIIGPYNIADLFFTHERGFYHGLSFLIICTATSISSPISGAFVEYNVGWKPFFWFAMAMIAFSQIWLIFFFPETKWRRDPENAKGVPKLHHHSTSNNAALATPVQDEKNPSDVEMIPSESKVMAIVGTGAPSAAQRWGVLPPRDKEYNIIKEMFMVFRVLQFPATWFVALWWMAYGGQVSGIGYVASQVWGAPPYNFGAGGIGLTALPGIIGQLIGFLVVGPLSDWDLARRTRQNGGIREPEMRLWLIIPGGAITIFGLVIYAVGVSHGWHWAIPLVLGAGVQAFGSAFPVVISCSYTIDTYKLYAGEISFCMTIFKNLWTFGAGEFLNTTILEIGTLKTLIYMGIPLYVMYIATFVFIWKGKAMRRWTSSSELLRLSR